MSCSCVWTCVCTSASVPKLRRVMTMDVETGVRLVYPRMYKLHDMNEEVSGELLRNKMRDKSSV